MQQGLPNSCSLVFQVEVVRFDRVPAKDCLQNSDDQKAMEQGESQCCETASNKNRHGPVTK